MKRIVKIVFIFLFIFVLTGCGETREKLEPGEFQTEMMKNGFDIQDSTSEMNYDYIVKIYVAKSTNYNIEYYNIVDEDYASVFYQNNVDAIEKSIVGDDGIELRESGNNFSKYTLVDSGRYKLVSRVDNTVIFLNVSDRYKEEIDDLMGKLGY